MKKQSKQPAITITQSKSKTASIEVTIKATWNENDEAGRERACRAIAEIFSKIIPPKRRANFLKQLQQAATEATKQQ